MEFALAAASAIASASAAVAATVVAAGPLAVAAFNAVNVLAVGAAATAAFGGLIPNVPGSTRNPLEWVADMEAPLSVAYGANVAAAGRLDYASDGYGPDNQYTSLVSTLSIGPIKGFNEYRSNDVVTTFGTNDVATSGPHAGKMWLQRKVGTQPQTALTSPTGLNGSATIPDWGSTYKQSGRAVCMLTLQENSKGSEFRGGEEKQLHIFDGVYGWDPRLDSTWPGGSGSCRLSDPSTWVWIDEGCIAGLNWAIGRWDGSNDGSPETFGVPYQAKLIAGIGASLEGIDVDAFVAGANIADANGWKIRAYPDTAMDESLVLDMLLQASGCVRNRASGKISCVSRAAVHPSVATLTERDLAGPIEVQLGVKRKDRRNAAISTFWSADHDYEMVSIDEVSDPAWVTEDRGTRRLTGLRFNYVPDKDQAAVLTYLTLANLREPARGVIPCKPYMRKIKPGHRFTISVAHYALSGVKVLCTKREFDPMSGVVKLHFVAETDAKYTDAFEQTGVVPTQPDIPTNPGETVDPPTGTSISVSGDEVTIGWTNGEARFFRTFIYYGPTATFADALEIGSKGGEAGEAQTATHKPGPGTWYYWLVTRSGGPGAYDLSDPVSLGSVVVTVEIDTDNLNDLNILRRTGGGDYTGDLTATEGADWTTNVSGRPTELTDGRITTALDASGVLRTAIPSALADTSNLLRRTGGGLFSGDLAATAGADWSSNLANRPTELTDGRVSAGLAANGDLARNIPTTILNGSNVLRYTGGGTFTGALDANRITNTNELTDGANLGGTAEWTGVSSRPANLASLSGSEGILNSAITLSAAGVLTGAGTSEQVNLSSLPGTVAGSQIADGAVSGVKLADAAVDLASAKVTGKSLANVDSTAATKLAGIEAGAQVNPADLAALDPTAATALAGKADASSLGDLATLDQVNTAQVVTNAVTVSGLASTDAQITFGENNTPVTVQTLVITTTGKPMSVRWGFYVRSKSTAGFNVQVALNRSTVPTGGGSPVTAGPDFGSYQAFELSGDDILNGVLANTVTDNPPAGTTTYTLSVTSALGTFLSTKTAEKRVIEVQERKTE